MKSPLARGLVWGVAVLICILCIWVSMHLTLLHFRTSAKDTGGWLGEVCTSFETSSCEKVAQSRWAWVPPMPDTEEKSAPTPAAGQLAENDEKDLQAKPTAAKGEDKKFRVPTAQLGMIYFSAILCWLLFTGPRAATRTGPHALFVVGAALGLPPAIFFEYIMWTQLEAWCPLCLVTHVASLVLTILALLLWPRITQTGPVVVAPTSSEGGGLFAAPPVSAPQWRAPGEWPTNGVIVMAAVCAVLMMVGQHFFIQFRSAVQRTISEKHYRDMYEKKWMQYERHWQHNYMAWSLTPPVAIPIENRPVRGAANALHTLVLFSDFECPACAKFAQYVDAQVLRLKTKQQQPAFKVIFKHWPLCKDCNPNLAGNSIHPAACDAALAVEAARIVGGDEGFWKMHDLLFANQAAWKKSRNFVPYARQLGLDESAFKQALTSSAARERIKQDIEDGATLGSELESPDRRAEIRVDSTPTIFVDGKRMNSPQKATTWQQIILTPVAQPAGAATQPSGPRVTTQPAGPRITQPVGPRVQPAPGPRVEPSPPPSTGHN